MIGKVILTTSEKNRLSKSVETVYSRAKDHLHSSISHLTHNNNKIYKDLFLTVWVAIIVIRTGTTDISVKDILKKCQKGTEFTFYGSNGKILAKIANLSELISTLSDISATIVQFHLFREITQDIFEPQHFDAYMFGSDLALWINYVLGDTELSHQVYELGKKESANLTILKQKLIDMLKKREKELIKFIRSGK